MVLTCFLCWFLWQWGRSAAQARETAAGLKANDDAIAGAVTKAIADHSAKLAAIEDNAAQLLGSANALIARVNDKDPDRNTVALLNTDIHEAQDLIAHADQAANDARKASDEELKALPELTSQAKDALAKFNTLLDTANVSIAGLQPIEKQVTAVLAEVQPAAAQLPQIATHVNGMTKSGDEMLGDAADKLHQYTHPNKKKLTFWGGLDGGVMWFHSHLLPPIF